MSLDYILTPKLLLLTLPAAANRRTAVQHPVSIILVQYDSISTRSTWHVYTRTYVQLNLVPRLTSELGTRSNSTATCTCTCKCKYVYVYMSRARSIRRIRESRLMEWSRIDVATKELWSGCVSCMEHSAVPMDPCHATNAWRRWAIDYQYVRFSVANSTSTQIMRPLQPRPTCM